ncbi:MAG: alpha/beta hydrolase, partial [Solobacterium sp.]|nr:alpha/beta hydrolase [Solobacterium sp.]
EAAKTVTDEDLNRFIILAEGMKGFDITGDLKKIICPVLVIGSKDDRVVGADASAKIISDLNPEYSPVLYMYEGYGHAAYDTAPDYKERIFRFLASE